MLHGERSEEGQGEGRHDVINWEIAFVSSMEIRGGQGKGCHKVIKQGAHIFVLHGEKKRRRPRCR